MAQENWKSVKNQVEDEDDEKGRTSASAKRKKKFPNSDSTSKSQGRVKDEGNRMKKEEADEDFFEEPTSKKASNKTDDKLQKKNKNKNKNKKEEALEKIKKKRVKKVFDLPGQKRDPPHERDPLRIFYGTLYKQVPASEMAATWLMESGLLPRETAKKIFERKQNTEQQSVASVKKQAESVTIEKKSETSPAYTQKKKTPDSKLESKQSKKRKIKEGSFDEMM